MKNSTKILLATGAILLASVAFTGSVVTIRNNRRLGFTSGTRREPSTINKIILHHTAGDLTLEQIRDIHVNERGWSGASYHYAIEKDGTINRLNDDLLVTWHNKADNTHSIGVALIGDFTNSDATEKQYRSARKLVNLLRQNYKIEYVRGHGEESNTTCPANLNIQRIKK
mgnify:CR=1 FL=1